MKDVKLLVVDDDPLQTMKTESYLEDLGYQDIIISNDASEAGRLIHAVEPDVLLMDIHLNAEKDGIDIVRSARTDKEFCLIYITSLHDRDTLNKMVDTRPDAYLLKPVTEKQLQTAIELAILNKEAGTPAITVAPESNWQKDIPLANSVFVKVGRGLKKLELEEIVYIESSKDKYCDVHTIDRCYAIRSSLSDLEAKLDGSKFMRSHRSFLVNLAHLSGVHQSGELILTGDKSVPLGQKYRPDIYKVLNILG